MSRGGCQCGCARVLRLEGYPELWRANPGRCGRGRISASGISNTACAADVSSSFQTLFTEKRQESRERSWEVEAKAVIPTVFRSSANVRVVTHESIEFCIQFCIQNCFATLLFRGGLFIYLFPSLVYIPEISWWSPIQLLLQPTSVLALSPKANWGVEPV